MTSGTMAVRYGMMPGMRNILILLAALLVFCPLAVHAEIYKRVLSDGTVVYSDEPHPDAEKISPPPIQVIPPPPPAAETGKATRQRQTKARAYDAVSIASPSDDEVIWNNEGKLTVTVTVAPQLQVEQGHRLVLTMDGETTAGPSAGTTFALDEVARGTHVLRAEVLGRSGATLVASRPVTFHMKQHSILFRQNPVQNGGGLP